MRTHPASIGIGLRHRHYREALDANTALGPVDFFEVHSENFFAEGGATRAVLDGARERLPISLHGVGLGLGNAHGLSERHLDRLAALVERCDPCLISEHVCWNAMPGEHGEVAFNDLLPLPYTQQALETLCEHIDRVQTRLKRPILIENASAYLRFKHEDYDELGFIAEAARRSGCALLLDVNNLYVNAMNFGFDAQRALDALKRDSVHEIHVAGHLELDDGLRIDDHGSPVCEAVWRLYAHAVQRFGAAPTLIEWDTDVPPLATLIEEAERAVREREHA